MSRSTEDLHRLAAELAALSPSERAQVISEATYQEKFRLPPKNWKPPKLSGGGQWIGGLMRREEIYGDDGR